MAAVVRIKRLTETNLPIKKSSGAAGLDIAASRDITVPAHGYAVVPTGIALELPPDLEAQLRPRSGLAAKHGIGLLNSPGTVDSDYRGEIQVILFNLSDNDYQVTRGDRIAQLVFSRVAEVVIQETSELGLTTRGSQGFGHTGR